MLASSLFVLSALTLTGVYVNEQNKTDPEGYVVDFSALENSEEEQVAEIPVEEVETQIANSGSAYNPTVDTDITVESTEDLIEPSIEIEGELTAATAIDSADILEIVEEEVMFEETVGEARTLSFQMEEGLTWPIVGNVLLNYSMDKTIYFPTLEQYQYNPAIVIEAVEGELITAATDGQVIRIFEDVQIGNAVTVDLGDGYELTYGQLTDVQVTEGSYVDTGDVIGSVASPTKYFAVEGSNVYFKMTKDGEPINPLAAIQTTIE